MEEMSLVHLPLHPYFSCHLEKAVLTLWLLESGTIKWKSELPYFQENSRVGTAELWLSHV